jgi:N-acetylmuramoyl-L-alanine amidase
MQPYVIRQGDTLAKVAHKFGFDPTDVWRDEKNVEIRERRQDANILAPGDILYIPDEYEQGEPSSTGLVIGATNVFIANAPTTTVKLKFLDEDFASQPCTIDELPDATELKTDKDGLITITLPVTIDTATIRFPGHDVECVLLIGHLDPVATVAGVQHRLQNLGYLDDTIPDEAADPDSFGAALWRLGAEGGSSAAASGPDGAPGDAAAPGGEEQGTETAPPPAGASTADATLDGVNDSRTSKRLADAHGC